MDANFTLFNIAAHVGGRRRLEYWWTTHTQTKVGMYDVKIKTESLVIKFFENLLFIFVYYIL